MSIPIRVQLLSFWVLLCGLSCVDGDANSATSCSSSFTQCANLGNATFPFGGSASCAASPSYILSNCSPSSREAYWGSFSAAALGVVVPPAVTVFSAGFNTVDHFSYEEQYQASIIVSWNQSLTGLGFCAPPFSSSNLSFYSIPSSINLTLFPDSSALEFQDITFLLFNCTHNTSDVLAQLGSESFVVQGDASDCVRYNSECRNVANVPSCIQWSVPSSTKELMLQHVLDTLACSHFMFGSSSFQGKWFTGSIGLRWTDSQCEQCHSAGGDCIRNATFLEKFNCMCTARGVSKTLDSNTQKCSADCFGGPFQCNTGAKIGIGVAVIVVVLGIFVVIRLGFLNFTIPIVISILKKILKKLQSVSYGHRRSLDLIDLDGLTERPMEFSYSSIASATKSFSMLVGEGGFGTVYKGILTQARSHEGLEQQIAVKVLEAKSKNSKKQFLNEVVTIGKIHHVNVVRLLGFCMQEDHDMLVYEYVVNGSLDSWLFDKKGKPQEHVLEWGQRYAIALGVARGLSYLHEECRHRTVHCDIKPQNILLDQDMHPKIADFGLARLMGRDESKVVTFAKGTPGYMAPEFWMGGESQLSTKFDVYSYGMVLLELISGQRNFKGVAEADVTSFPAVAFKAAMEGHLESIIDARLNITSYADEAQKQVQWQQIKTAAFVALWCIQDHPARRPQMSEVVKYLEGGGTISECPPQPTISISCASWPQQEFYPIGSNHDNECTPLSLG